MGRRSSPSTPRRQLSYSSRTYSGRTDPFYFMIDAIPSSWRNSGSLRLVVRVVAGLNRILYLVLCHINDFLCSPLQISAGVADLIDAIVYAINNIASQFLSSFRRQKQRNHGAYPCPQNKS